MTTRTCSTKDCGRPLGAANKSGVCSSCSSGYKPKSDVGPAPKRIASVEVKPPPAAKKVKKAPAPIGPVEEFFTLAEALGLKPQDMLDGWCRAWVTTTRERALDLKGAPASE